MKILRAVIAAALSYQCGIALAEDAQKAKLPGAKMLASAPSTDGNGRFVLGQISDFRADQYVLDTKTGRVWQFADGSNGSKVLVPVAFLPEEQKAPAPVTNH